MQVNPHANLYDGSFTTPCAQVHVTLGHSTVVAEALYFGMPDGCGQEPAVALSAMIGRIGQLALNVSAFAPALG